MKLLDWIRKRMMDGEQNISGFRNIQVINKSHKPKIGYKEKRIRSRIKILNKKK